MVKRFTHPVLGEIVGYSNLAEFDHDVGPIEPDVDDDEPEDPR